MKRIQDRNPVKSQLPEALFEELRKEVMQELEQSHEVQDEEIYQKIDRVLNRKKEDRYLKLSDRVDLRKRIFNSLRRMDVLQDFLEDRGITEIMVNGPNSIYIERGGQLFQTTSHFSSRERLADIIQQIVASANRRVNEASPIVDARLSDGSRVNVVLNPIALNGPALTIRKFPEHSVTLYDLICWNAINKEVSWFLEELVKAGYNIFVCGGTGSGKTTFLNALSQCIPEDERVVTIEDSAELQLPVKNLVSLETRNATQEGENAITIRDLMKTSLRMRPDRIVLGEVRGEEALELLQIFNTGHDGSMSTGHGNSPKDMISRLETMVLMGVDMPIPAIRGQIAAALDIIVYLGRLRDRTRKVLEIVEVVGMLDGEVQLNKLYEFVERGEEDGKVKGELEGSYQSLIHTKKLKDAGLVLETEEKASTKKPFEKKADGSE